MKKMVWTLTVVFALALLAGGCAQKAQEPAPEAPVEEAVQQAPAAVPMVEVESSSLEKVGYDPANKTLRVVFRENGDVYVYSDVPAETYEALMQAESKGRYLVENIKNTYSFVKE